MNETHSSSGFASGLLRFAETDTPIRGAERKVIGIKELRTVAAEQHASLAHTQGEALRMNLLPKRYLRNFSTFSAQDQARLLKARVLLVGLGGLGGTVLEILARMGVGTIIGADGDVFEESNLNRQALCTEKTLGQPKSAAAAARVQELNTGVSFVPVNEYLQKERMRHYCAQADLVIDALGGLEFREELHTAAREAELPLVSAAVAGWAGFVGSRQPGEQGLEHFFQTAGSDHGAEETLGCPAPGVRFAATVQTSEALRMLLGKDEPQKHPGRILLFDLASFYFETVVL